MGHLRALVLINGVYGLINAFAVCIVPAMMMNGRDDGVFDDFSTLLISPILVLVGIGHLYAAKQIHRRSSRLLATVLALIYFLGFPIGTAFAVYSLWVIWSNDETALAFSKGR